MNVSGGGFITGPWIVWERLDAGERAMADGEGDATGGELASGVLVQ